MSKWMIAAKRADFAAIAEKYGISPVLARLLRNRDITGDEAIAMYLSGGTGDLRDPLLMEDMSEAADILGEAVRSGRRIRIIGDYDVDGICASYILCRGLRELNGGLPVYADCRLPDRVTDGYGLNVRLIEEAYADKVDLILTCDNGIAAGEAVTRAKELGMTVVVTDHHEVPYREEGGSRIYVLPPADAVVDPMRTDPETGGHAYPFPRICGAAVAYKLIRAMADKASGSADAGLFRELLGFAALATVCDVMPLVDENRIIVREGLKFLENTANRGMRALISVTGLRGQTISCYHAGFILGPCLNASGRLDSAERALDLFLAEDESDEELIRRASELKELNDSRKSMTQRGVEEALRIIGSPEQAEDKVLVVYLADCHESLAGIIAGKVRERYNRPAFVFTPSASRGLLKGSGRSIEAYDMYEGMSAASGLLEKFGGHKAAGGLTLKEENLEAFRSFVNENCALTRDDLSEVLHLDMELPAAYINDSLVREIGGMEPCGTANPRPLFACRDMRIEYLRVMGKNRNALRMTFAGPDGRWYNGVRFGEADCFLEEIDGVFGTGTAEALQRNGGPGYRRGAYPEVRADLAYTPEFNTFRGMTDIQLSVRDMRIHG